MPSMPFADPFGLWWVGLLIMIVVIVIAFIVGIWILAVAMPFMMAAWMIISKIITVPLAALGIVKKGSTLGVKGVVKSGKSLIKIPKK